MAPLGNLQAPQPITQLLLLKAATVLHLTQCSIMCTSNPTLILKTKPDTETHTLLRDTNWCSSSGHPFHDLCAKAPGFN